MFRRVLLIIVVCVSLLAFALEAFAPLGGDILGTNFGTKSSTYSWPVAYYPPPSLSPSATKLACNSCHPSRTAAASATVSPSDMILAKKPDTTIDAPVDPPVPVDIFAHLVAKFLKNDDWMIVSGEIFNFDLYTTCVNQPYNADNSSPNSRQYKGTTLYAYNDSFDPMKGGKWEGDLDWLYIVWAPIFNDALAAEGDNGCVNHTWWRTFIDTSVDPPVWEVCDKYANPENSTYDPDFICPIQIMAFEWTLATCQPDALDPTKCCTPDPTNPDDPCVLYNVIGGTCVEDGIETDEIPCVRTCDNYDPDLPACQ